MSSSPVVDAKDITISRKCFKKKARSGLKAPNNSNPAIKESTIRKKESKQNLNFLPKEIKVKKEMGKNRIPVENLVKKTKANKNPDNPENIYEAFKNPA